MNRDKVAKILSYEIFEAMCHYLISRDKYYINVHTLIDQQINMISEEEWKFLADTKKINEIAVFDQIITMWTDHYLSDNIKVDSDLQLLCSSLQICMVD